MSKVIARGFGATDVGRKRKSNEDAFLLDEALGLYVVCDGMGGHAAGEVASQEAADSIYGMVKNGGSKLRPMIDPVSTEEAQAYLRLMESAIQAATYMVFSMAEFDREHRGMGTTVSTLLVSGDHAVFGQVGDSRIYRVRQGRIEQITEDHTLVAWQIKQGLITAEEANYSPQRNVITRAVGNKDYVEVDTGLLALEPGDRFLLCSDGLHGYLEDRDLEFLSHLDAAEAPQQFIDLANARGGKDNITAIVLEILLAP